MGTLFFLLGFFIIFDEKYIIKKVDDERYIEKRKGRKAEDGLSRYKMFLSMFSIILGLFCMVNYIIR